MEHEAKYLCETCGGSGFNPETVEWVCFGPPGSDEEEGFVGPDARHESYGHLEKCGWYPKRVRLGP